MATAPKLLVPISSDGGSAGTKTLAGFVLEVDDRLLATIDVAWALLAHDPMLDSIAVHASGDPLPGCDNELVEASYEDRDRLALTLDRLEGSARPVRKRDAALLSRCGIRGVDGEVVVVSRHTPPCLRLYDNGDYEYFSSGPIDAITPRGLRQEQALRRRRNRRSERASVAAQ